MVCYTSNYSKKPFLFDPTCKIQLDRLSDNVFVINFGHLYEWKALLLIVIVGACTQNQ